MLLQIYKAGSIPADRLEALKHRSSRDFLDPQLFEQSKRIAEDVRAGADAAVIEATARFDQVLLTSDQLRVSDDEFTRARAGLPTEVRAAIEMAIENHRRYNEALLPPALKLFDIADGIVGGRKVSPIGRVALYVPSGRGSYPSTFITIAVPAVVAGVPEIEVIVPPRSDGTVDPALLVAADMLGTRRIVRANGVAGIAAAAIGTEALPKVMKIVGPGGPMIMASQYYAQLQGVDVALYFGPSECMVIADDSADPALVAADLLSEAEHGSDSSAILLTDSAALGKAVQQEVEQQLAELPQWRRQFATSAIERFGGAIVTDDLDQAVALANDWANEHIQVVTRDPWTVAQRLVHASEILVGQSTTFSAISYAIGVPACLPTGQFARVYSPVTVDTYLRSSAVAALDDTGLEALSSAITALATHEGFPAHVRSIALRRHTE
jgi:histidinol dehydrogenase